MKSAYKALAKYYDLIYSFKDYEKESNQILNLVKKYKKSEGNQLLEVGCGTGKHLNYLKEHFSCTGFDLNKEMIDIAKQSVKEVEFSVADMIDFNFDKKFDVITCYLFVQFLGLCKDHRKC